MAAPSILPLLVGVLEPYLEERQREYLDSGSQAPTLPGTKGKVNVRQVVRELAERDGNVKLTHEQHLFNKPELRGPINAVAEQQGLAPIGSRSPDEESDAVRTRIGKIAGEASELRQALAEREALIESLRGENDALRSQLRLVEETGMILRTGDVR